MREDEAGKKETTEEEIDAQEVKESALYLADLWSYQSINFLGDFEHDETEESHQ